MMSPSKLNNVAVNVARPAARLQVRHERAGDLRVTLVSPDRVSAVLMAAVGHCPLGDGVVSSNPQELYTGETLHDQSTEPTHGADYTFSTSAAAVFPDCEVRLSGRRGGHRAAHHARAWRGSWLNRKIWPFRLY